MSWTIPANVLDAHREWTQTRDYGAGGRFTLGKGEVSHYLQARDVYLPHACMAGANLYGADFRGATLYGADFVLANLRGGSFAGADLCEADFRGADLAGTALDGARIGGAVGLVAVGPVGRNGRIIYAVDHGHEIMIQAGCSWATAEATIRKIRAEYSRDPLRCGAYVDAVELACKLLIVERERRDDDLDRQLGGTA